MIGNDFFVRAAARLLESGWLIELIIEPIHGVWVVDWRSPDESNFGSIAIEDGSYPRMEAVLRALVFTLYMRNQHGLANI